MSFCTFLCSSLGQHHLSVREWDESKQMRELVSRCPRGPRSGANVGREVLAGEGRAGRDEVGGCALEDDPAAVVAGAGAEVDDPVGVRHDRLVVLDDDDRLARVDEPVEQAEQLLDVGEVQTGGRLVEDVDAALLGQVGGQLEPLHGPALSSPSRLKTIRSIALASVAVPTVERELAPIRSWSTMIAVVSPSSRSTSGRASVGMKPCTKAL